MGLSSHVANRVGPAVGFTMAGMELVVCGCLVAWHCRSWPWWGSFWFSASLLLFQSAFGAQTWCGCFGRAHVPFGARLAIIAVMLCLSFAGLRSTSRAAGYGAG